MNPGPFFTHIESYCVRKTILLPPLPFPSLLLFQSFLFLFFFLFSFSFLTLFLALWNVILLRIIGCLQIQSVYLFLALSLNTLNLSLQGVEWQITILSYQICYTSLKFNYTVLFLMWLLMNAWDYWFRSSLLSTGLLCLTLVHHMIEQNLIKNIVYSHNHGVLYNFRGFQRHTLGFDWWKLCIN